MSAPYEVTNLPGGQLLITEPLDRLFAFGMLLLPIVPMLFFLWRAVRSRSLFPLWGVLIVLPVLWFCSRGLSTGSLTLDRANNTALFHRPAGFGHHDVTIPLTQIDHAEVRGRVQSDYVAVVLKDGDDMLFSDSSQQPGKGRAAKAINDYIGYGQR